VKLSEAQEGALDWLWRDSRRRWNGAPLDDPSIAALDALVRKGLAEKTGSSGFPIYYKMTDAGRAALRSREGE